MKRTLAAAMTATLLLVALAPVAAAKMNRVNICHYDTTTNSFARISISNNGTAISAHVGHGDAFPGDTVPNMHGYTFDAACVPVETIFAVAYTDMDTGDGGYDAGVDVLIAKLVDTNDDGTLSAGDTVVMGSYPLDFTATIFGVYGTQAHLVASVLTNDARQIYVEGTNGHNYAFFAYAPAAGIPNLMEEFAEVRTSDNNYGTWLRDSRSSGDTDNLYVTLASPSDPNVSAGYMTRVDDNDDAFIDVDFTQ